MSTLVLLDSWLNNNTLKTVADKGPFGNGAEQCQTLFELNQISEAEYQDH